jgi:hypothetical protein
MKYYHLLIYVFARKIKPATKDDDDLFDRVFWLLNTITFFIAIPLMFVIYGFLHIPTTAIQILIPLIIFCVANYIYLKRNNLFNEILDRHDKQNIKLTTFRNCVIVIVLFLLAAWIISLVWLHPR